MENIFKPVFRWHLLKQSLDPSQGIFGGEEAMFKNMEESKKQALLTKSIMLQTKKPRKGASPTRKEARSLQLWGLRARVRRTLRNGPIKKEPRRKHPTPRRAPRSRTPSPVTHISGFQIQLLLVNPPVVSRVGVESVWTLLSHRYPGVLIGQSVFLYSLQLSLCQPRVFNRKLLFPGYLGS